MIESEQKKNEIDYTNQIEVNKEVISTLTKDKYNNLEEHPIDIDNDLSDFEEDVEHKLDMMNNKLDEILKILHQKPVKIEVKPKEPHISTIPFADVTERLKTNGIGEVKTTIEEFMRTHVDILPHVGTKWRDAPEPKKVDFDEYLKSKNPKIASIVNKPKRKGRPKKQ